MSAEILIELSGVDVARAEAPDTVLVGGVQWRIAAGDFWAVSGDPESGRSSLLATAAGLQPPARGAVKIFGRELAEASEAEQIDWRKRIGFVYEHGGRLLSHLTVAENVALPLQYHLDLGEAETEAQVQEWLTRAELQSCADQKPSRLSPRLAQRGALLRALAVPTQVLFLDDPLGGEGPSGQRWWLGFLRDICTQRAAGGDPLTVVATGDELPPWRALATQFAAIEKRQLCLGG